MKPPYTSRQGQFLAFIHHYTTLHGRPPAEAELVEFFQVTPPSVHQMILTLERRGLISRTPGQARSIRLAMPYETLPPLQSGSVSASTRLPVRQTEGRQSDRSEQRPHPIGKAMNVRPDRRNDEARLVLLHRVHVILGGSPEKSLRIGDLLNRALPIKFMEGGISLLFG